MQSLIYANIIAVAIDSSNDYSAYLPLLLCLSGFIYFAIIYFRYRNSDKRHMHEKETQTKVENATAYDNFVQHRKRLRNSSMAGANGGLIEGAQNVGNPMLDAGKVLKDLTKL
ncbi:MAG: hypothetical protein LBG97_01320 [Coriobacteriales bacterium]|jgi:hypothetical protein|nr:hypothetical protein [Coriobacteriales bacterium]